MEIITVGAQKGGAGKTPVAANLAFALARRQNTRVLLLDTDPQASLSEYLLGAETYDQEMTIYNAIMEMKPIAPMEIKENVHLLNAHDELSEAEYRLLTMSNPDGRLKAVLEMYTYDFCIIDTPPNLGLLTRNALVAAHRVIIPVKPEISAYRTLKRFHSTLEDVKKSGLNRNLTVWWILPTQYEKRTAHHKEILEIIQTEYKEKVYPEPSNKTTKYNDATIMKTDISTLDKSLGKYWDRLAATHPAIRKEAINAEKGNEYVRDTQRKQEIPRSNSAR
jgi:chromosome partitioning protein